MAKRSDCACVNCKLGRRFQGNIQRINNSLNQITPAALDSHVSSDLIRLHIVFLHAVFEDTLREIVRNRYPKGETNWLKNVNLDGLSASKYTVEDLLKFDDQRTIKDLIHQSVSSHLDKTSFNDVNQISTWLKRVNIDVSTLDIFLPAIENGIRRRHKIVHESDLSDPTNLDDMTTSPLETKELTDYINAVCGFMTGVLELIRGQPVNAELHQAFADKISS